MDRDMELRIKGHLYEITHVNDEVIDSRQGFPSAIRGYEKTLQSIAECAEAETVDDVAEKIKDDIRSNESRTSNQNVRRQARKHISRHGYTPDDYLNNA